MVAWEKHIRLVTTAAQRLREMEWVPLAAMLAIAVAVWGFVELADDVVEGEAEKFDRVILLAMRTPGDVSDPLGPVWFEELVRDVTALGSLGVLATVVVASCGFLWLQRNRMAVVYVLAAVLGAQLLSSTLKNAFDRPRPDLAPHGMRVYTASFPSGHSTMSAATYLTLGALLARYQKPKRLRFYLVFMAIVLTLLVGASRVYLSVHWPTDVLAGWTIGAAWALMCWVVAAQLQRRRVIEPPPAEST
jgi:undecaprenyl-diphosphatase